MAMTRGKGARRAHQGVEGRHTWGGEVYIMLLESSVHSAHLIIAMWGYDAHPCNRIEPPCCCILWTGFWGPRTSERVGSWRAEVPKEERSMHETRDNPLFNQGCLLIIASTFHDIAREENLTMVSIRDLVKECKRHQCVYISTRSGEIYSGVWCHDLALVESFLPFTLLFRLFVFFIVIITYTYMGNATCLHQLHCAYGAKPKKESSPKYLWK